MKIYSFDVFDTLLTRLVLDPKDVFHLLSRSNEVTGADLPPRLKRNFWAERVWSEFLACRRYGTDAVDIRAIYRTLGSRHGLAPEVVDDLIRAEIRLEDRIIVAIRGADAIVNRARQRGQVVFLTDMYLPHEFIAGKLEALTLKKDNDLLYVSGEKGASKRTGRLYRLLLADLAVRPEQVTHLGDNYRDDVLVPQALGIRIWRSASGYDRRAWQKKWRYAGELLRAYIRLRKT